MTLSVHVVGELLGASGLAWPHSQYDGFSLARVLDALSLHPSSQRSYFCKWRLVLDEQRQEASGADKLGSLWQLVRGDSRGQTQVHHASSGGSLAMPELQRQCNSSDVPVELPKMDTVWAHPIDLQLRVLSAAAWMSWPSLEFQVWSLDCFQQEELHGTARLALPLGTKEYVLDVPILQQRPTTLVESLSRATGIPLPVGTVDSTEMARSDSSVHGAGSQVRGNEEDIVLQGVGTLYLRLGVVSRGIRQPCDTSAW